MMIKDTELESNTLPNSAKDGHRLLLPTCSRFGKICDLTRSTSVLLFEIISRRYSSFWFPDVLQNRRPVAGARSR